jgi:hypothetical protein
MALGSEYQDSADLVVFLAPYLVAYHFYAFVSACCISLGVQRQAVFNLASLFLVVPMTLLVAGWTGNLAAFAYAKCFFLVYASWFLVKPIPAYLRVHILKHAVVSLILIFLMTLVLAPQFGDNLVGL